MNNRPSFLKDVTIFSKYMNIKASHMEKHRTKWCKYKKELVHLRSFNTNVPPRSVSYQETESIQKASLYLSFE